MSILHTLHTQLKHRKTIPFVEFMQCALYAPGEGYYNSNLDKIGKGGDFITAPELTPLYGKTLAAQCYQVMKEQNASVLFEFGAGSGALCVSLLTHLDVLELLPERYIILEVSSDLQRRQHDLIGEKIPHLAHLVTWIDQWPTQPFNGVVIANEVLDAMPVDRFMYTEQGIMESHITLDEHEQLIEVFKTCDNPRLLAYIKERLELPVIPYLSEVNLFIDDWILNVYHMLNQGAVFLIDYGFPQHEYYHPDRNQGTIMCHHHHHSHTDFLQNPGEQDITAHVNFTHVAEAAQQAGFHVAGYTNQASFLLANGLLSFINSESEVEQMRAKQAVKVLTHPSEMGELFKVIALTKNTDIILNGFLLHDKRVSL